jgi:hypothetical protein
MNPCLDYSILKPFILPIFSLNGKWDFVQELLHLVSHPCKPDYKAHRPPRPTSRISAPVFVTLLSCNISSFNFSSIKQFSRTTEWWYTMDVCRIQAYRLCCHTLTTCHTCNYKNLQPDRKLAPFNQYRSNKRHSWPGVHKSNDVQPGTSSVPSLSTHCIDKNEF